MTDPGLIPDDLEDRVLSILADEGNDTDTAIESLCREHPEHAQGIRDFARVTGSQGDGDYIGRFRILDTLGEGGMGTVFLAEQREPVRRRVAVKVIKLGMDSKEVLARFELERQALAVMSHPAIARVFEAGVNAQGQPFFVMEFVEGEPLTDYCDRHKLTLKERIGVFQQVCRGVQHAHQKGVLHRDLKPGNILVSRKGDEHTVKIIDFGLARATDQQLIDNTIYTEKGQLIGTPEYMSPEQAGGVAFDIDTRTDVYSLGVVLYELLSGELPFPSERLRKAGLLEIQRVIEQVEPEKPSTRISSAGESALDWANSRRLSPAALRKQLRGDLDWIVLRAMAKEPERRYASALGLALDLGRYLEHEPVEAGPPSATYRLAKMVRKYRIQVTAAAIVFVVAVAGALVAWRYAAETTEKEAEVRKVLVETRAFALVHASASAQNVDPMRALLLAREAVRLHRSPRTMQRLRDAIGESRQAAVLRGHEDEVLTSVFSHQGDRILTAGKDDTARVWDLEGRQLAVLRGHEGDVVSVAFSKKGDRILTASADKTARLWSRGGDLLISLIGHEEQVISAVFSPSGDQVLTASRDHTARLWDLEGRQLRVFRHENWVQSAVFSAAGDRVLTGSFDHTARLWDLEGRVLATFRGHERALISAEFSPQGDRVVTAAWDDSARLWDLEGNQLTVFRPPGAGVTAATFSPAGDRVLIRDCYGYTARVCDLEGRQLAALRGHENQIFSAVFSPSGSRILTASMDYTARLWNLEGDPLIVLRGHDTVVESAVFSPKGDRVLTASRDGTVRLWDLEVNRLPVLQHPEWVFSAVFSPKGDLLLTGGGNSKTTGGTDWTARLWDRAGEPLAVLSGHEDKLVSALFSPAGDRVVTASLDKTARLWDLEGKQLLVLRGHEGAVLSAVVSPSGDRILTASADRTARLWSLSGTQLAEFRGHAGDVYSAVFSASGDRILTGSEDRTARLWNLDGRQLTVSPVLENWVAETAFTAEGDPVAVTKKDHIVRIWDLEGRQLVALRGHEDLVYSVEFSPSFDRIVTSSVDKTARVWNLQGDQLAVLRGHAWTVTSASFSPDGDHVFTASGDVTARVWMVRDEDISKLADERIGREKLSPEEREMYADLLEGGAKQDR